MLTGFLNTRLLPDRFIEPLETAENWQAVFEILQDAAQERPGSRPLNLHPIWTFNLNQYLTITAGGLLGETGDRIDLQRPAARNALETLDHFFERAAARPAESDERPDLASCLAVMAYSFHTSIECKQRPSWKPWRYPLGESGRYLEGLNIGFANRGSAHPEETRRFLMHLATAQTQDWFTRSEREQPVSARLADPLKAYAADEKKILEAMRMKSVVFGERVPGLVRVAEAIVPPLSRHWMAGRMSTDEFCRLVQERGNECLAACRAEGTR
jgi:hypothetical protein